MKNALLLSLCILFSSCVYGITVPPDVVAIDISFAENTSQPVARPLKTITITVEEEGQTRATYSFTNQAIEKCIKALEINEFVSQPNYLIAQQQPLQNF
jgi:hypothetical protein